MVHGDDGGARPGVSGFAVHHELGLQERTRRIQVASHALRGTVIMRLFVLMLAAALIVPSTAHAQVDFTGEWGPAYHEDRPERIPGPEIGDYMGLPINESARRAADSWDADRISVVTPYQC